jgi:putative aldouronate transport system substrate-binding protein
MEEMTNIHFDWHQPAGTAVTEAFNLMIASNEYENIIASFSQYYTKGVDNGIDEDIIYSLDDYTGDLPNMMSLLRADENKMLDALSDAGRIWGFYSIYSEKQGPWGGPVVRQDLVDKYNVKLETYDDWENFLTICRDSEGMTSGPLGLSSMSFSYIWSFNSGFNVGGATAPFLNKDGKVVAGFFEDGFKDYVVLMNDWYTKGLIQQDYFTSGNVFGGAIPDFAEGRVVSGESTYDLSPYKSALPENMKIAPVALPVKNVGDINHVRMADTILSSGNSAAISTSTKAEDIPLLCKFYDYMYTEEGSFFANWGTEGETFTYGADGKPQYTDLILKNPDGLSFLGANVVYLGARNMPGIYEWTRELVGDEILCMELWSKADTAWLYPGGATMTADESTEYATTYSDIQTLVSEKIPSFITGATSMSEWDAFINQIKSMNIDRCIELKQSALDRYYGRIK